MIGGKRLQSNLIRVQKSKLGQYQATIPKPIALALGLTDHSIVEYQISQRGVYIKKYEEQQNGNI